MMPFNFDFFPYQSRRYTIRLDEYLIEQEPTADLSDPDEMLRLAKAYIFGKELLLINEQYRDAFVLAFMDRYLFNEIGQETWQMFRYTLAGTVRRNAEYINHMFGFAGKDLFTEYAIRSRDKSMTSDHTSNGSVDGSTTSTGSHAVTTGHTNSVEHNGTDTVTDSITGKETANDESSNVTDASSKTTDTKTSTGNSNTKDTVTGTKSGTSETTHDNTGSQTTTGSTSNESTGSTSHTESAKSGMSDTPQNGLNPIEAGDYLSSGSVTSGSANDTTSGSTNGSSNSSTTNDLHEKTTGKSSDNSSENRTGEIKNTGSESGSSDTIGKSTVTGTDKKVTDVTKSENGSKTSSFTDTTNGGTTNEGTTNNSDTTKTVTTGNSTDTGSANENATTYFLDYSKISQITSWIDRILAVFINCFMLVR